MIKPGGKDRKATESFIILSRLAQLPAQVFDAQQIDLVGPFQEWADISNAAFQSREVNRA